MTLTSADLMTMLRASMHAPSRPSPGYVVGELEAPEGSRRADALFLPLGHARRGEIHGYEFKISRSDLITELNDPMKADPWLRYCTTWNLFVADPALITGLTIPDEWGILAPPASPKRRALTVLRPAPKLRPRANMAPALMQVVARLYYADGTTEARLQSLLDQAERRAQSGDAARERARVAEAQLARIDPSTRNPNIDLITEIVDRLGSEWTANWKRVREHYTTDRLVALLTDIANAENVLAELATRADTELRDLEDLHEKRGRRIAEARKALTPKGKTR